MVVSLLSALLDYVRREENAGDGVTFSVVIDDPELGTYAVRSKAYIDADRGGYSGYRETEIMEGLSQTTASRLVELLNKKEKRG
jgi:hypothetical protein